MHSELRPSRLTLPEEKAALATTTYKKFNPVISNHPDLPPIKWSLIGAVAPQLPNTPAGELPAADAVVITWAAAEWAALQHVFCQSDQSMPYSDRTNGSWPGWQKYDKDVPTAPDPTWTFWGYYRLVTMGTKNILLFKSNTHLDYPGATFLTELISRFISVVKPSLILSIGTAGGTIVTDHVGTVNVVHAGSLYDASEPPSQWKTYSNNWQAGWKLIDQSGFNGLLVPIPTTTGDLTALVSQFNSFYATSYTMAELNINGLNMGDNLPVLNNMTGAGTPLLTTNTFVVGTSSGNLKSYACVEMDDAVIAEACGSSQTHFGFVRNISDPVQNTALPSKIQASWGSAIYDSYGLYTSFNGALAAWAILSV